MDRSIIPSLRVAHGLYNILVFLLFLYQGWLGIRIRKERLQSRLPTAGITRRHRQFGPILSVIGFTGFISGLVVIFLDSGMLFIFRFHFTAGFVISIFIIIAYFSSRRIKGSDSAGRTHHLAAGIILICLYFIQIFIGIAILFGRTIPFRA